MTSHKSSELLSLLEKQKSALRKNDYGGANELSHRISSLIHKSAHAGFSQEQSELVARSFAQIELMLASQKQTVSQQLQTLRSRRKPLKTYRDQVKT